MAFTNPFAPKTQNPLQKPVIKSNGNSNNGFTIAKPSVSTVMQDDHIFNGLLTDDDEVVELSKPKKYAPSREGVLSEDEFTQLLQKEIEERRKKYPSSTFKSSRFLRAELLLKAPDDYFDSYVQIVKEGTAQVRNQLADSDLAATVKKAQENPTDDAYQSTAYSTVSGMAESFVSSRRLSGFQRKIATVLICDEIIGFGPLDPLWRSKSVTEIICNGPKDVQGEIAGVIYRFPCLKFRDVDHIMSLLERLYGSIGKVVSQSTPIVKGRLPDKSRIFTIHPAVAPDGPNLNVRRHPEGFWTPDALVQRGAASEEMMSFIGNLIYKGASGFVVGGTASGKTSLLNALSGFIKPTSRVITLEDNIEMKPNPKKLLAAAMECRDASKEDASTAVTMRDLVKASMQMKPHVIIVGEVTDSAAYDLCQALNTGHAGMSTFHANSSELSITRVCSLTAQSGLTTIEGALDLVSAAFDFIVNTRHFHTDGSRRIVSVDEVGTTPILKEGRLILPVKPLWKFVHDRTDSGGKIIGHWEQVGELSKERVENKLLNMERDLTWEELKVLSSIPESEMVK